MSPAARLRLFEATGIELEYMIVDRATLDVRPVADELLRSVTGRYDAEVERGAVSWSNELALHVIELKTTEPALALDGLGELFQAQVASMDGVLRPMGARLLPTAMHPWMDPYRELRLWPHDADVIYAAFDRIFDCRGHGWANLQSVHINLPFSGDEELARLHTAIRLLLPLLPALAASSPAADGRLTGLMDTRLEMYRGNAARVPSVAGLVVPEPVFSRAEYEAVVLGRIYDDMAPLDPDGILRHEWVNARGAIARFDRMAIEIRVLDVQECPRADIAISAAVVAAVRALVDERWSDSASQRAWSTGTLAALLADTTRAGDAALIHDRRYLQALGLADTARCRAGEVWQHLIETTLEHSAGNGWDDVFEAYRRSGCLARRIGTALGPEPSRERMREVYLCLADCLAAGRVFQDDDC